MAGAHIEELPLHVELYDHVLGVLGEQPELALADRELGRRRVALALGQEHPHIVPDGRCEGAILDRPDARPPDVLVTDDPRELTGVEDGRDEHGADPGRA